MINVIICEDNNMERKKIKSIVNSFFINNKLDFKIYEYSDYDEKFTNTILEKIPFKVYLLDIETPSRSGIDVAREIRKNDVESVIIFLTGHEELGNTILKKDLMFLSFINKFDNFEERLNNSLKKSLELINKKKILRFVDKNIVYTIDFNDILYITKESNERKSIIKTTYGEFKVSKSLSEIINMLDDRFTQTHRACYINMDKKVCIDKTNKIITFDNGETTDLLSDKYKKGVL